MARSTCLLMAILLLGGCCIQYAEQEIQLRYNPEDDSADLLLIYKGITASEEREKVVEDAAAIVVRLLQGHRAFETPVGHFDLDEESLYEEGADPLAAEVAQGVELVDWGVFLDEKERLSGWQRFHLSGASRAMELLNRRISAAVLEAAEDGECFARETPILDDRTRELWRRRAASGEPWIYFTEGDLEVDLPATREAWDRLQESAITEAFKADGDDPLRFIAQVLLHLRRLEIGEEQVIATLGAPVTGIYRFSVRHAGVQYSPKLLEKLLARGVLIETPDLAAEGKTELEWVRSQLGLEPR